MRRGTHRRRRWRVGDADFLFFDSARRCGGQGDPASSAPSVEGERHRTLTWLLGIGLAVVEGVLLVHSFPFVCFF